MNMIIVVVVKNLTQVQSSRLAKVSSLHKNMSYDILIVIISPPVFRSSHFYQTLKIIHFTTHLNGPDAPKVSVPVIHVPCTNSTQYSKLHLDRFSRFCTAHGRVPILYSVH